MENFPRRSHKLFDFVKHLFEEELRLWKILSVFDAGIVDVNLVLIEV